MRARLVGHCEFFLALLALASVSADPYSVNVQGKEERDTAYQPILDALEEQYRDLNMEQR